MSKLIRILLLKRPTRPPVLRRISNVFVVTFAQMISRLEYKKWNESGFRPLLCTYRLNWARRTSWGWWDDWDDTVLQTQDSKIEPWRSEAEHATFWSRRLPTILTFTRGWGSNIFVSLKSPRPGTEPQTLAWKAAVLTTTLGPPPRLEYHPLQKRRSLTHCWFNVGPPSATLAQHWSNNGGTSLTWSWWAGDNNILYQITGHLVSYTAKYTAANRRNVGSNFGSMLWRWPNIEPTLGQYVVLGLPSTLQSSVDGGDRACGISTCSRTTFWHINDENTRHIFSKFKATLLWTLRTNTGFFHGFFSITRSTIKLYVTFFRVKFVVI